MSRVVTVAATQMACSWDSQANIANADKLVREAAAKGAQIILIQELFETPYFCQKPNAEYLQLATPVEENPAIQHFQKVAAELQVVLPISFRSEEHTSELQSLMRISYAVFCLKTKTHSLQQITHVSLCIQH